MGLFFEPETFPFSHSFCHVMSPGTSVQPQYRLCAGGPHYFGAEPVREPYLVREQEVRSG